MARSEARLQFGIWREGLADVSPHAKLLYCVLLTEPTVNAAGVGAWRLSRWMRNASLSDGETVKALEELTAGDPRTARVVVDEDTEEVLVRTIIRHDGTAEMPYVLKGAIAVALRTASPLLRWVLAQELRKLSPKKPDMVSPKSGRLIVYPDPHAAAEELDPGHSPSPPGTRARLFTDPLERVSRPFVDPLLKKGSPDPLEREGGGGGGGGGGKGSCSVGGSVSVNADASTKRATKPTDDLDARFDEFWTAYPRKIQKQDALKAWREVRRKLVEPDRIITGAARYARLQAGADPKFVKHPASWLRAGGFDDEPEPSRIAPRTALPPDAAFAEFRRRADADEAARIAGLPSPVIDPQPPSDSTDPREWDRARRIEWLDLHESEIRTALSRTARA